MRQQGGGAGLSLEARWICLFVCLFVLSRQAYHVGRLFKNMHPSSQYLSRSLIRSQAVLAVIQQQKPAKTNSRRI